MAKYECKVCGYIYNEQHAGRSFDELTECPICNESKENFIALDAENNPIMEEKAEDKTANDFYAQAENADNVKEEALFEGAEVKSENVEEQAEPFSIYKEIKETPNVTNASDSEFVVERRQDFWTPVSANVEKKEETSNNTTGWTISNAMGSVEKVIGSEEESKEEVKEDGASSAEADDMPAFNSRIESFYSSAEPVRASHIISGDEEEENFKPLWNAGGGTVQRVIDPFNDKNDSVVKAENIGMVMPAEEPVVEEILGEEDLVEDVIQVATEMDETVGEAEEVSEAVEEAEESEEEILFQEETVEEDAEEINEEAVEEVVLEDEMIVSAEAEEESLFVDEVEDMDSTADEFLDDEDDDFFTEMTMDAVVDVADDAHNHGDSGISEDDVFKAIDAIEFNDDVPEGGRIEVVSADGTEEVDLEAIFEEAAEETAEDVLEDVEIPEEDNFVFEEATEDEIEVTVEGAVSEEDDEAFFFEAVEADAETGATGESVVDDTDTMEATEEIVVEEVVVEAEAEDVAVEDSELEAQESEDDEPFFFEEVDDIPAEATEDDFEAELADEATETEEMSEEFAEETAEETVEETVEDTIDVADEITEEVAEEVTEDIAEEVAEEVDSEAEATEESPRVKAWSFLDDVVGAGVATGVGVAGVNFVTKAMDEVVEEEVTDEDIEEVFVDFAEAVKADDADHVIKTNLAEELFAAEERVAEERDADVCADNSVEEEIKDPAYCNNLEKILIVPAQLNPMPLPEGTAVEGRTVLGIASERPLVLDDPVFSTGDYNMVQYIPNSGLTSEDYQKADAIEIIVGHGNGIEKTINSKEDLRQVVNFLRLESDGCPIGIKMGAARIERDLEFCVFAKPDYVVLNNFDVVPLPYALHRATKFLNTVQSDMDIVIALDGAKDAEELAKIMAMGADVIALRNRPERMDEMVEGLKGYARITGHYDVEDLNVKDLCTIDREIAEFTDIYHV